MKRRESSSILASFIEGDGSIGSVWQDRGRRELCILVLEIRHVDVVYILPSIVNVKKTSGWELSSVRATYFPKVVAIVGKREDQHLRNVCWRIVHWERE